MKYALLIAIENYQGGSLPRVKYAKADATNIGSALALHSFSMNMEILLDSEATKATIESRVRRLCSNLSPDDELVFFYAGHGFAENDHNYITCFDTQRGDLTSTSIAIQDFLKQIRDTGCERIIMFLDSCHSGIEIEENMRGIMSEMSEDEFRDFFKDSQYQVGFASCKSDEVSYSSDKLSHGIWSYHVIRALKGEAFSALDKGNLLTADSLQSYISAEVPSTIRDTFTKAYKQTPCVFGSFTKNFVVADLDLIIQSKRAAAKVELGEPKRLMFRGQEVNRVKSLSGFKKGYFVPNEVNDNAQNFIIGISQDKLKEEAESWFQSIKGAFNYARKDIKLDFDFGDGIATINCKDFELGISIRQNLLNPSEYVLYTDAWRFDSPEIIMSPEFNKVFADTFNTLTFEYDSYIDIKGVIDAIEDCRDKRLSINYHSDLSSCTMRIVGLKEEIKLEPHSFNIISQETLEPKVLVERFLTAQKLLVSYREALQLPVPH